jgi:ABC-type transport system substrate-binding protein
LEAPPPVKKPTSKILWAVVAVIVVAVVVAGAAALVLTGPPAPVKPVTIELWYNDDGHYGDTEPTVAVLLKAQLEKTGVFTVNLKHSAWRTMVGQFANNQLPFFQLGWFPDFADSDNYVTPFMRTGFQSLGTNYSNPVMDRLIDNETLVTQGREKIFWDIQNLTARDVPTLPLWVTSAVAVREPVVTGVILDPFLFRYYFIGKNNAPTSTLTMSTSDKLTSLDPAVEYDLFSGTVVGNIFDTLYTTTPTNGSEIPQTIPLLADGAPINPVGGDSKVWEVKLKTGLVFADGITPITAQDVQFSFRRLAMINNPESAVFYITGLMDGNALRNNPDTVISMPDGPTGLRVQFHLNKTYSIFPNLLTFSTTSVLNHNVYPVDTAVDNPTTLPLGNFGGSGPYYVESTNLQDSIVFAKNPNYNFKTLWAQYASKGAPSIDVPVSDRFSISIKSAAPAVRGDIETHAVNLAYRNLNPPDVSALQGDPTLKVDIGNSPQIRYLVFNSGKAPVNKVQVRQAIAYSVNRQEIVDIVFGAAAHPLYSMLPPGWFGHRESFKEMYGSTPDAAKAKALLQQAGLIVYMPPVEWAVTGRPED